MPFFATDSTFPDYDFEDDRDRKQAVGTTSPSLPKPSADDLDSEDCGIIGTHREEGRDEQQMP